MAIFANFVEMHFLRTSSKRFNEKNPQPCNFFIAASDKSQKKQTRNLKNDRVSYFVQFSRTGASPGTSSMLSVEYQVSEEYKVAFNLKPSRPAARGNKHHTQTDQQACCPAIHSH